MALNRILVKDGGFGTQLTVHVGEKIDGDPLWSARYNASNPTAIIETHLDFLKSGADIILTNTYQASIEGYVEYLGLDEEQSLELIKGTVHLAHTAREKYLEELTDDEKRAIYPGFPMIFGSIGPYGAHLHDGSEYKGSYAEYVPRETIQKWHRIRLGAVLEGGVDGLAIETIPCQMEVEVLVDLLCDEYPDVKFWISFQCNVDEGTLAHGEPLGDVVKSVWSRLEKRNAIENCLAIGVNCLNPQYVSPLFKLINSAFPENKKLPLVVYPNSGEIYDVKVGWKGKKDCVPLENYVPEWIELGAKIIGGCCRTYAEDIARIKECVDRLSKN